MKIYLAGVEMKLHNARIISQITDNPGTVSVLGSYFSIRQRGIKTYSALLPCMKDFMLDSGAFSFMNGQQTCDWDKYIEEYAAYINENGITKFFELDIDVLVGYDKVKEYRSCLERITGRPSIPVWHRTRGKAEFLRLCDEYSYIAIGGIAIGHIRRDEYRYFTSLIREAHRRKCRIHALGFTNFEGLKKYHFDSVDSSTWTAGGRFGSLYKFENGMLRQAVTSRMGTRVCDYAGVDSYNFSEWVKFQKYAEVHL